MAKSLLTWQTPDQEIMWRSRDNRETDLTKRGHPILAALYDPVGASAEQRWMAKRRRRLLAGARSAALEIGGGTGANLPHYRGVKRVIVPSPSLS
jgi:hypothetical protein